MGKYCLYIKETSSEWSHSGYCSNPNTSYKTCEYEDEKTMISVPSIEFISNYSNVKILWIKKLIKLIKKLLYF